MSKHASAAASASDAKVRIEPSDPDQDQTSPPSMAPGSGYDPDAPKVHKSPPKEDIYPDWKPVPVAKRNRRKA